MPAGPVSTAGTRPSAAASPAPGATLRWQRGLDGPVVPGPVLAPGGLLLAGTNAGTLYGLDARTGRTRWRSSTGSPYGIDLSTSPLVRGRLVLRGRVAWRFTIAHDIEVSPAVTSDGTVVLGTNDRDEYGLTPAGKVRWRVARNAWSSSTAAVRGRRTAFGDHRGVVQTVDERGRVVGRAQGMGQVWTRPAIDADGSVFFGTHSGDVQGFAAGGRELLRLKTGGSVESYPALGPDGTLYIGSEDARLDAVDTTAPRR